MWYSCSFGFTKVVGALQFNAFQYCFVSMSNDFQINGCLFFLDPFFQN